MTTQQIQTAAGTVEQSNPTGLRLAGDREWFNRSRPEYDKTGGAEFPSVGTPAIVEYTTSGSNGKRYVYAVRYDEAYVGGPALAPSTAPVAQPTAPASPVRVLSREESINRLSVLKTAVEIVAAADVRDDLATVEEQVYQIAERLLAWVEYSG